MANDDKNIRFRAVIDSGEFDRSISDIQRKMKNLQQEMSQMRQASRTVASDPVVGQFAKDFFQASQERSGQGLREDINKQRQEIQRTRERVEAKKKELEVLKEEMKIKEQSGELDKEAIDAMKRKIDMSQRLVDNLNRVGATQSRDLGSMLSTAQAAGIDVGMGEQNMGALSAERIAQLRGRAANVRAYRGMGFGRGSARMLSMFGGPAAVAGALGAGTAFAAQSASNYMDYFATRDNQTAISLGQAGGTANQELMRAAQGDGFENIMRDPFRRRGQEAAAEEFENRRLRDILRGGASPRSTLGGIGAIGAAGAMGLAGAAYGSALGPLGTIAGGLVGAGVGYFGANMGIGLATGDQSVVGPLANTRDYQARMMAEQLSRGRQVEQAELDRNVTYRASMEYMRRNRGLFQGMQATFGEENPMALGGMLENIQRAGITGQAGLRLAQAQQSASGMTMGVEDVGDISTAFRLQQAGLTNASQAMGVMRGLTGTFGGEGDTDDSMKRLFAEAVSIGVDDSTMVQELKQFTDASIRLSQSTGMRVEEAASEVAKGMAGEVTEFGLRSQMSAREIERGMSTAGGASLDYKLAFSQSEQGRKMLGGMTNTEDVLQFANLDINNISEDNPIVKSMMEKMDVDNIDEFRRIKTEFDITGSLRRGTTRERLRGLTDEMAGMSPEARMEFMQGEGSQRFQEFFAAAEAENPLFKTQFGTATQLIGRLATGRKPEIADRADQNLSQEEIEAIPEYLRRDDLESSGDRMFGDLMGRGERSMGAAFERGDAAAGLQAQRVANMPGEGGRTPFEIFSEGSTKYMEATDKFVEAVNQMQQLLTDPRTAQGDRDNAREALSNLIRSAFGDVLSEQQGGGDISTEQPSATPSTGN